MRGSGWSSWGVSRVRAILTLSGPIITSHLVSFVQKLCMQCSTLWLILPGRTRFCDPILILSEVAVLSSTDKEFYGRMFQPDVPICILHYNTHNSFALFGSIFVVSKGTASWFSPFLFHQLPCLFADKGAFSSFSAAIERSLSLSFKISHGRVIVPRIMLLIVSFSGTYRMTIPGSI